MSNRNPDTVQMTTRGSQLIDDNDKPVALGGLITSNSITLTGTGTVATAIFHITGTVMINGIWGVVTTTLGANHTAAAWRLNDQSATIDITLSTGTALSGAIAGSTIIKKNVSSSAVAFLNNSAGRFSEPTTLETMIFSPFVVMKKTAATTDIEYVYATTDNPTSGVIQHFVNWYPISADGKVTPI